MKALAIQAVTSCQKHAPWLDEWSLRQAHEVALRYIEGTSTLQAFADAFAEAETWGSRTDNDHRTWSALESLLLASRLETGFYVTSGAKWHARSRSRRLALEALDSCVK